MVHLKDVARIELGGENDNVVAKINGKPASGLGIKLATGANALDTAAAIKAKLAELQPYFPQGMKVVYPYDTTPFVKISIHEVVKTLFEAIVLVFLVMYLFRRIYAQRSFPPSQSRLFYSGPLRCFPHSATPLIP
ncbi:Acriflavine resistance protein B [Raoultella terrigena]|uniref:Acriflavine resistance protein B n=1 Tax=Raoultella terrigena TaxID=577 RepID=A0A3P8IQ00_RAOTE|nr:Acriflavine resistance protein B [Raoultella terrigena]